MEKLVEWVVERPGGLSFALFHQKQIISPEHSTTPSLVLLPYLQNGGANFYRGWF